MAAKIITVPDGQGGYNEVYECPKTTRDANEWLERAGVRHIKFGTSKGKAVLKDVMTNRVYMTANKISDLCYSLAFQPIQMRRFGIPFYDWYRPDSAWNKIGEVIITVKQ